MTKSKYLFEFRGLSNPEHESFEAGPFTEEEAAEYGHTQTLNLCEATGRAWVSKWSPVETPKPPMSKHVSRAIFLIAVVVIACALVYFLARVR